MEPKIRQSRVFPLALCFFSLLLVSGVQAALIKVRVTGENARIKAAPEYGSQSVAPVAPNTILDAEPKQGEWYKVYMPKEGTQISGYIHESFLQELSEAEAQQLMGLSGLTKTQGQITAEIEIELTECMSIIRQGLELDKAVEDLRPLIARAFTVEDPQTQNKIASEIYYWLGSAYAKKEDAYNALREFRNMFEVDYNYAKELTRTITEPMVSSLIDHAEKQYLGKLVEYSLEIITEPKEATIKVNGKDIGKTTPHLYRSPIPRFDLELEKEGFKPYREPVFLYKETDTRNIKLESIGRTIILKSQPKEGRVFLDGQDTGKLTDCELPYVPFGGRTVRIEKKHYADWEETVQVLEGEGTMSVEATLLAKTYQPFNRWGGPDGKFIKFPRAITFDKEGCYYLLDATDAKARKFDAESRLIGSWSTAGQIKELKEPCGIAVDDQGSAYITDTKACCVMKFARNGRLITKWGKQGLKPGEFSGPTGIALDAAGNVYVADSMNNRIAKYSPQGTLIKTWGNLGTGQGEFTYPAGVAVNQKNEIVVVDKVHVQKFTPDGEFIATWGKVGSGEGELNRPLGICIDALNCVYLADTGNNRILKFDGNGRFIAQWGGTGTGDGQMIGPCGIAISGKGSVFVVEKDNSRIQEFTVPAQ